MPVEKPASSPLTDTPPPPPSPPSPTTSSAPSIAPLLSNTRSPSVPESMVSSFESINSSTSDSNLVPVGVGNDDGMEKKVKVAARDDGGGRWRQGSNLLLQEKVGASLLAHTAALQFLEGIQNYRLEEILSATNFSDGNLITEGRLGKVYKGQHLQYGNLVNFAVRRLDREYGQGDEFETEILMLKSLQHKNIVSFFWLCDEDTEKTG
ncbi:proline-rich receptor-like protein kinase PERK10 [Helianthus annuus]|uniref:proline-rich receptor-like protein kinase PERK10 n=1 Tax=Helianthus annuus TaxID=4232 RepID=UPI001652B823|nr:proline-rich receptor-like protein kinase PERK10 [Helianthus annuus]